MRELIRKILKEEESEFMSCYPFFNEFKTPEEGVKQIGPNGETNIDDFFWKVVDFVDYPSDNDYERIHDLLLKLNNFCGVPKETFHSLVNAFTIKQKAITNNLGDKITEYIGGDSWDDLRAEIISRGKDYYEMTLNDPKIINTMIDDMDFTESFSYAFPYTNELV